MILRYEDQFHVKKVNISKIDMNENITIELSRFNSLSVLNIKRVKGLPAKPRNVVKNGENSFSV